MIYHVLTEAEPFSEFRGGAISRWVANVLRDDPQGLVVAPSADESWGFPADRLMILPEVEGYGRLKRQARRWLPPFVRDRAPAVIFRRLLKRLKQDDVVWLHNRPDFAAGIGSAVRAVGARLVLHMHNSHLVTSPSAMIEKLDADRCVFVSEFLKREAAAVSPKFRSGHVLYNGADEAIFHPRSGKGGGADPLTILFAGRLVPDKGAHVFSAALSILQSENINVRGIIVGGSGFGARRPTAYVDELIREAPANLHFHDYCVGAELGGLFRNADIFCLPSVWNEPLSLALLEAMASRVPVVASRCGGIVEVLSGGGGLLVEQNSPQALAEALKRIALDATLRNALADEAYAAFLRRFRWSSVRTAYRSILDRPRHA